MFSANLRLPFFWNRLEVFLLLVTRERGCEELLFRELEVSHFRFLVLYVRLLAHHLVFTVCTYLQQLWSFLSVVSQEMCHSLQTKTQTDLAWGIVSRWLWWHENVTLEASTPKPTQLWRVFPKPSFICMIIWVLRLCEQWHLVATARTIPSGEEALWYK